MKNKDIKKIHRLQDILISSAILILGLLFTFIFPSWNWLGISLLIVAAFMLPFYRTGYAIESQKGIFSKKEILLPHECKEQLADYIEGRTDSLDIDPFAKGGLLLEWYFKKDGSQNFGQLFDFEDCVYTSQSQLSELSAEKINTILKFQS
ncbi:MAG: hypothetical protein Q4G10_02895 [Bacteroidia bacterium]|nr:hypothetical protein [Bacteroidia bacterium]